MNAANQSEEVRQKVRKEGMKEGKESGSQMEQTSEDLLHGSPSFFRPKPFLHDASLTVDTHRRRQTDREYKDYPDPPTLLAPHSDFPAFRKERKGK
mmetsp:Transcript_46730/g.92275  ORF Transcript_46730/g.92275 Transcript_46730/m.92275 type:complete len:96 (+) Transcript_46730:922-1209(+)